MATRVRKTKKDSGLEEVLEAGKETVETTIRSTTETAAKGYQQAFDAGQKNVESLVKQYDELNEFGREAIEAWLAAGTATTKGVETVGAEWMAFTKTQIDESINATKQIMAAKSLQEAAEMQAGYAKSSFDAYMTKSAELGEFWTKTTQDLFAPLNARCNAFFEKMTSDAS